MHKNVFRDLDGISTSVTWFPNKYIEDDIKKKLDKTRDQLASDEMAYDIRQYKISISYLSTVNTLTPSFKYMNNGAVITA